MKLSGVICLLSIADKRIKDLNLDMFNQLFGDKTFARVVLGTTNWGKVDENVGKEREQHCYSSWRRRSGTPSPLRDRSGCASMKQR